MKRIIFLILVMAATALSAPTYKICYIISGSDTSVHNSNVDSIRYDIVNDPQGQLPGTWTVDLLSRLNAEGKDSSYWNIYDLIITWGTEENGSAASYDTSLDAILDTLPIPVICRDAYIANGDPMFLGTAARAVSSAWMKLNDTDRGEFIVRKTYTDNYHYGDSLRIFTPSARVTHGIRGMAHEVKTLVRYDGDLINTDADTALVAICYAADTNAANTLAPAKRAYFGLIPSWQYASWSARDMWYRTLRWAINDTLIDTCVTQTRIGREGIDATFLEHSGTSCQTTWHYGGFLGGLLSGYDVRDRATIIRARTTAINTQLPDTSADWAYDIGDVSVSFRIEGIAEENPANSFSWWEGLFEVLYAADYVWVDYKASAIQLDSTCGSWVSDEPHNLMNSHYLQYPTYPWASAQASTRGTDYSTVAFDSVWIQDPVASNYLTFRNLKSYLDEARADSTANQGLITHTIGTVTNDGEITLHAENDVANYASVRNTPFFLIPITWRAGNTGAADLDSSILIQDLFGNDSLEFDVTVNGDIPNSQNLVVSNGSSSATFSCATTEESPAVDWLTTSIIGGGTTTYYVIVGVDQTGLAVGYYSTWIKATCASVADSPDSAKVTLTVNAEAARPAVGTVKIQ